MSFGRYDDAGGLPVAWSYNIFERYPAADLEPSPGSHWRAFRHRDGGIWYADDNHDYTLSGKTQCHACGGQGRIERGGRAAPRWLPLCPLGGRAANTYGDYQSDCTICDGRGYTYVPARILRG